MLELTLVSSVSIECLLKLISGVSIECELESLSFCSVCEPMSFPAFLRIDGIPIDNGLPFFSDIVHALLSLSFSSNWFEYDEEDI